MKRLLDTFDTKILDELRANGRIAHAELGERVNLSRNAVRQRIDRLERDGVIRGYTILTDDDHRHLRNQAAAVIFVYRTDRMRGADVIRQIKQIPEVKACDVLSGELDLMVRVETAHAERLKQIWGQISALPGVSDTVTSMVLG